MCINTTHICDEIDDCPEGRDEGPLCSKSPTTLSYNVFYLAVLHLNRIVFN